MQPLRSWASPSRKKSPARADPVSWVHRARGNVRGLELMRSVGHRVAREVVDRRGDGARLEHIQRLQNFENLELLAGVNDRLGNVDVLAILVVQDQGRRRGKLETLGTEPHRVSRAGDLLGLDSHVGAKRAAGDYQGVGAHSDRASPGPDRLVLDV